MRVNSVILTALLMVVAGCSRGPVNVSITNQSGIRLTNLSVNSDHYAQMLGSFSPGMSASFDYPQSDSRGWVHFEANGKKVDSRGTNYSAYFRIGYGRPLSLVIRADLSVAANGTQSH
jgi:hypothetical protein